MSAAARAGDLASAESWFEKVAWSIGRCLPCMIGKEDPDIDLLSEASLVFDGHLQHHPTLISSGLDSVKAVGARVDPNVVTFTTLISAAANQGRLQDAEDA